MIRVRAGLRVEHRTARLRISLAPATCCLPLPPTPACRAPRQPPRGTRLLRFDDGRLKLFDGAASLPDQNLAQPRASKHRRTQTGWLVDVRNRSSASTVPAASSSRAQAPTRLDSRTSAKAATMRHVRRHAGRRQLGTPLADPLECNGGRLGAELEVQSRELLASGKFGIVAGVRSSGTLAARPGSHRGGARQPVRRARARTRLVVVARPEIPLARG